MEKKVIGVYAPANPAHIWFEEKYLTIYWNKILVLPKNKTF